MVARDHTCMPIIHVQTQYLCSEPLYETELDVFWTTLRPVYSVCLQETVDAWSLGVMAFERLTGSPALSMLEGKENVRNMSQTTRHCCSMAGNLRQAHAVVVLYAFNIAASGALHASIGLTPSFTADHCCDSLGFCFLSM